MSIDTATRLGATTGVVHSFIYFTPEAAEEYNKVGLPAEAHYFGSRAAALGAVSADLVIATFYNFKPANVRPAIAAAWSSADPEEIQQARMTAAGQVLAVFAGDVDDAAVAEATSLAAKMVADMTYEGRSLAAANQSVALPSDPFARLWQLITVIREWRGDAHIGALIAADIDAVEALVLHVATGAFPAKVAKATRGWTEEEWHAGIERLAGRDLVRDNGELTAHGAEYREAIEHRTNDICRRQVETIGDDATLRLIELLEPLRTGLLASGVFDAFRRSREKDPDS